MQAAASPASHPLHSLTVGVAGAHLKPPLAAVVPSEGIPRAHWRDAACLLLLCSGRNPTRAFQRQKSLGLCCCCFVKLRLLVAVALPRRREFPQAPAGDWLTPGHEWHGAVCKPC